MTHPEEQTIGEAQDRGDAGELYQRTKEDIIPVLEDLDKNIIYVIDLARKGVPELAIRVGDLRHYGRRIRQILAS